MTMETRGREHASGIAGGAERVPLRVQRDRVADRYVSSCNAGTPAKGTSSTGGPLAASGGVEPPNEAIRRGMLESENVRRIQRVRGSFLRWDAQFDLC